MLQPSDVAMVAPLPYHARRYMFLWIFLSAAVIMVNKYVLSMSGFPYPVALTCTHMLFCSILAFALVKLGFVEAVPISADTYLG